MQAESRHRETYTDSYRHRERAAGSCREIQRERDLRQRESVTQIKRQWETERKRDLDTETEREKLK